MPHRVEDHEPDDHPGAQGERHLDHPVAQLPDVIHQGHAALGVLLALGPDEMLAYDPGALDGTGEFRHRRLPLPAYLPTSEPGASWIAGSAGPRPEPDPSPRPAAGRGSAAVARQSGTAGDPVAARRGARPAGTRLPSRWRPEPEWGRPAPSRPRAGPALPSSGCASTGPGNAPRKAASSIRTAR